MDENRACVKELDEKLSGYEDRLDKIKSDIVNRQELIDFFELDTDDVEKLETALKLMFDRVGQLQNAIVIAQNQNDEKEVFELNLELITIGELRNETLIKLNDLKSKE